MAILEALVFLILDTAFSDFLTEFGSVTFSFSVALLESSRILARMRSLL